MAIDGTFSPSDALLFSLSKFFLSDHCLVTLSKLSLVSLILVFTESNACALSAIFRLFYPYDLVGLSDCQQIMWLYLFMVSNSDSMFLCEWVCSCSFTLLPSHFLNRNSSAKPQVSPANNTSAQWSALASYCLVSPKEESVTYGPFWQCKHNFCFLPNH